jgi:ATP-dependent DNA helicase RecG
VEAAFIPVYHVTEGLTPKMLRYYIKQVLPLREKAPECLPLETIRRRGLTSLSNALLGIHFPKNKQSLFLAKRRLGFEELFILQLNYQLRKKKWEKKRAISLKINLPFIKKIIKDLPFELTKDQKIALWQILKDGEKERPMNRLLEGDVGSGKTVVAAIAALNVANNGRQAALMAPTEILAQQHFYELSKIALKTKIPCCLLTRSFARSTEKGGEEIKKEALLEKIKKGKIKIIVGTHSIIQEKALFSDLVLAIIDEQHRFGVRQRLSLIKKSEKNDGLPTITPHLLSMTATPIPRTLALTIYGDLDISLIKEMPKGRKKIITKAILPEKRPEAYRFIEQQIKKGRQAFVICPLIEESEILTTKAAEAEYQKLKNDIFPKLSVRLLHGRMKAIEKEEAMQSFKQNETAILVATSVVEVGVDIPNATIMMIEGAERFGLSQLHQLRGRVGRGDFQSYCFLFAESPSPKTWKRLRILENENNGFILAQKDLGLRGPGEFLGERQSGFSSLAIASLNDRALIKEAREEAQIIANNDSLLKSYPLLAQKLKFLEKEVHLE